MSILPGIAGVLARMVGDTDYSGSLVCGSSTVVVGTDPKSGTEIDSTANGFGSSDPIYGSFGSLSPSSWRGFTILGIYQADSSGVTVLIVSGNASALHPVLRVAGANQNLGSGSFSSGKTTFFTSGTVADPFTGTKAVAIT